MKNSLPCFRQALITDMALDKLVPVDDFERRLFIARRNIEFEIAARLSLVPRDCYVVSLSSQSIIYKGLIRGGKIADFYVDLLDIDLKLILLFFMNDTVQIQRRRGIWPNLSERLPIMGKSIR